MYEFSTDAVTSHHKLAGLKTQSYRRPRWLGGKGCTCQCRRPRFNPWEDLLKKEMVANSSILAGKIPWMEEPGRLQSMG